jgi:HSP20 family protein
MANITRFDPFFSRLDPFGDFEDVFRRMLRPVRWEVEGTPAEIKVDVEENDKAYVVKAEIPGVKKEDIQVDIDGNILSIRAERKQEKEEKKGEKVIYSERSYGMASRSLTLPADVDSQGASASYKDGVLDLTLPKKAGAQAKRISIQ